MNHQKVYEIIIETARFQNRKRLIKTNFSYVYYENHHIIPKCLNGTDNKENLVLLTAKEHYICHKLLTYIYKGNSDLVFAFHCMAWNKRYKNYVSSRDYAYVKELRSLAPSHKKGKNLKNEMIKKYGEITGNIRYTKYLEKSHKSHVNYPQSKETREKRSRSISGQKRKKEVGIKISNSLKGHTFTSETINKIKNTLKSKKIICEHCNREIPYRNYYQWHGDKCKLKNK